MNMTNRVPLKSIASFSKGEQINGDLLLKDGGYPYLNGGINPSGMWDEYNVEADTVTISEGGNSCGYVNYMDTPFWCGAHCYYLYDVKCDVKFLYHALKNSQNKLMSLRSGACMPNIKKKDLGEFELPAPPPLEIQSEIAYNLDKVSEAIEICRKILETLDYLVKAKFAEMFGDIAKKVSLSYYISSLTAGKSLAGEELCVNKVLKTGAVSYDYFDETQVKFLPKDYVPQKEHAVHAGDVIISRMNTIELVGAAAYVWQIQNNIYLPDRLWRAELSPNVNPVFVWQILIQRDTKENIRKVASGTSGSMKNISKIDLLKLPVIDVPLPLQEQFAEYVKKIDLAKSAVKKTLETAQTLKNALMQKYFG